LSGSPLLDAASWGAALHRAGFGRVRRLAARTDEGQDVFIAEAAAIHPILASGGVTEIKQEAPAAPTPKVAVPAARRLQSPKNTARIEQAIVDGVRNVLQLDPNEELDRRAAFLDLGVDSILAVEIINKVNSALGIQLRTTDLYNYATIARLVEHAGSLENADPPADVDADADSSTRRSAMNDQDALELLQALSRGAIDETAAHELLEKV
jgi:acyl carrier protein